MGGTQKTEGLAAIFVAYKKKRYVLLNKLLFQNIYIVYSTSKIPNVGSYIGHTISSN